MNGRTSDPPDSVRRWLRVTGRPVDRLVRLLQNRPVDAPVEPHPDQPTQHRADQRDDGGDRDTDHRHRRRGLLADPQGGQIEPVEDVLLHADSRPRSAR